MTVTTVMVNILGSCDRRYYELITVSIVIILVATITIIIITIAIATIIREKI